MPDNELPLIVRPGESLHVADTGGGRILAEMVGAALSLSNHALAEHYNEQGSSPLDKGDCNMAIADCNLDEKLTEEGFIPGDVMNEALNIPGKFLDWCCEMVARFGRGIKDFLHEVWSCINNTARRVLNFSERGMNSSKSTEEAAEVNSYSEDHKCDVDLE